MNEVWCVQLGFHVWTIVVPMCSIPPTQFQAFSNHLPTRERQRCIKRMGMEPRNQVCTKLCLSLLFGPTLMIKTKTKKKISITLWPTGPTLVQSYNTCVLPHSIQIIIHTSPGNQNFFYYYFFKYKYKDVLIFIIKIIKKIK